MTDNGTSPGCFHVRLSVAPLKQMAELMAQMKGWRFPRSAERGSIEAAEPWTNRLNRRGFHVRLSVAPLKLASGTGPGLKIASFHVRLSVAPLKRRSLR